MAKNNRTASQIVSEIEKLKPNVRASFVVDTLTYLYRGGRCNAVAAMAGGVLKLHPRIVVEDGAMNASKKYRGKIASVVMNYVKDMEKDLKKARPERVFITHSGCEQETVEKVRAYLKELDIFDEILELSEYADQEGVDGVMVLPPYYFPISEAGMVTYFGKIAEALPQTNLYLYNFPDRTGCDITPDVTVELVKKYENIKGYKDTQAGMDHTRELIRRVKSIRPDFEIYSGFDDNFCTQHSCGRRRMHRRSFQRISASDERLGRGIP